MPDILEQVEVAAFGNYLTTTPAIKHALKELMIIVSSSSSLPILVRGETGTGKDVIAKEIFRFRTALGATGGFAVVNCAAISNNFFQSTLFGHKRGAFTSAHTSRTGLIEQTDNGVLFLDEIGKLGKPAQQCLLRLIENRTYSVLGDSAEQELADCQIVAASNRDLEQMVHDGDFLEDLYYRLHGFWITLPPLRERMQDLVLLSDHFLGFSPGDSEPLSKEARARLLEHSWPGNVRELRDLLLRAKLLAQGQEIEEGHLRFLPSPHTEKPKESTFADATLAEVERMLVEAKLRQNPAISIRELAKNLDISFGKARRLRGLVE